MECRNHEGFVKTTAALHRDVENLRDTAVDARNESEIVTRLAQQAQKDTRSLKAMTILGIMYLPATLIAVSQTT